MKTFAPGHSLSVTATNIDGRYTFHFMEFDPFETSSLELSLLPEDSLICGRVPVWAALQFTRNMDAINGVIEHFTLLHGD